MPGIYPGATFNFGIDTTAGTRPGVVIVDESVYLLRDKNRLTKERVSFEIFIGLHNYLHFYFKYWNY